MSAAESLPPSMAKCIYMDYNGTSPIYLVRNFLGTFFQQQQLRHHAMSSATTCACWSADAICLPVVQRALVAECNVWRWLFGWFVHMLLCKVL
jgi:hypothetical protein